MASFAYNAAKVSLGKEEIDWVNDTIKVALLTSSHTPDQDNDQYFSDIANEVSGGGYTAGGYALSTKVVTQDDTNNRAIYDAADVSQGSLTIADYQYFLIYIDTGVAATSRLICLIDLGSAQSLDNGTLDIVWGAGGVFNITG